jgi:hypothetical protein
MVWYRKIFGAMNIVRGVGRRFLLSSEHLDPDEWLVQDDKRHEGLATR